MERLDQFLSEVYTPSPNDRIKIKTIVADFQTWIIGKYGAPEWNNYGKSHIYRALNSCQRYKHKRYKEGMYLTGLRPRGIDEHLQESSMRPPVRLHILKIPGDISTFPSSLPHPSATPADPTSSENTSLSPSNEVTVISSPKVTVPLSEVKETTTPSSALTETPAPVSLRPPIVQSARRKSDRRHRPAPPKPKTPEVYVPGSSEMPDLDVFIRPHLYRGIAPDKLPKSGPIGTGLSPTPQPIVRN